MKSVVLRAAGAVVLAMAVSGCSSARRLGGTPATIPTAEAGGAPIEAPVEATALAVAEGRRPLTDVGSCPLHWQRRAVGSVFQIPAAIMARPMDRVVEATCRCVRPGEAVSVVADIDFFAGRVVASAPEAPAIASCLAELDLAFEPWEVSGVSDCIDCGPRRFGVFRGSPPVDAPRDEGHVRVRYPLRIDRTEE